MEPAAAPGTRSGWVAWIAYRIRPEYRILGEIDRFRLGAFLVEILESPHDRVEVDCYATVGFRSDCDLLVRYRAPTPEEIQEIAVKVRNSGLGRYLDVSYDWLAIERPGPYPGGPEAKHSEGERPWYAVRPYAKKGEWFFLPFEDRKRIVHAWQAVVARHPGIRVTSSYGFGLGDAEWVLEFESSSLGDYEELARELCETEVGKYARFEGPVLVGRKVTAHEALELAGAL